jgi:hypothetical protein
MKIGLIDVDSHNFPNLPVMKISAYHKRCGDTVEWWNGLVHYDQVYVSKVFDDKYFSWQEPAINADIIHYGGTGFKESVNLPRDIEHQYPDYSLYPKHKEAYGFLTRGCPRNCGFCVVGEKEGLLSKQVADLSEFWDGQKEIKLLDPNILACRDYERLFQSLADSVAYVDFTQGLDARLLDTDNIALLQKIKVKRYHFAWDQEEDSDRIIKNLLLFKELTGTDQSKAIVYVLTNYNTSFEFDLYRVYTLREIGLNPYIMVYNRPSAEKRLKNLQRWVNNRIIWASCPKFENYKLK